MQKLAGSHERHMLGLELMVLIHLFHVVVGYLLMLTNQFMIIGMRLAQIKMLWELIMVIYPWATPLVRWLLGHVGLVG